MNTSTGALGTLIAEEGMSRGWPVDFVAGPFSAVPHAPNDEPAKLMLHNTPWQEDVLPTLRRIAERGETSAIFHVMAVLDYIPESPMNSKRSSGAPWSVTLVPTPKIIDGMCTLFPQALLVAFKLEMGVDEAILQERAARLAARSGADLVVANLLDWISPGQYRCLIIDKTGSVKERLSGRMQTATYLWDYVEEVMRYDILT